MEPKVAQKIDRFFSEYTDQKINQGETLIEAEKEPDGVFYLKEGVVRQYIITSSGEELTLNLFRPVSIFPMAWVLNDTVNSHYFEAMTPVVVKRAAKNKVLEFFQSENDVLLDLLQRIYRGLEGMFLRMEHLMNGSAQNRLISELVIFAKRFGEMKDKQTVVRLKLTEREIASISGITRETVSRELHNLEQRGLVEFKKNTLVVNNLEKLEKELES